MITYFYNIFNYLSINLKMLLLLIVFSVVVCIMGYLYLNVSTENILFAEKELIGNNYELTMINLINSIQNANNKNDTNTINSFKEFTQVQKQYDYILDFIDEKSQKSKHLESRTSSKAGGLKRREPLKAV